MSAEEQKQLKKLLDVKEAGISQVAFKFNKHLHKGGKYAEDLDGSDDEDAFNSMPKTRDGEAFELDFKLDAFRDEIQLKRRGKQSKLMSQTSAAELIQQEIKIQDSSRTKQLAYEQNNDNYLNKMSTFASLQNEFGKDTLNDFATNFILSLGGNDMYSEFFATESLSKIPNYMEMGEPNPTILRSCEGSFKINPFIDPKIGVATKKHLNIANQIMTLKNQSPVYTGSVPCYLVNQVFEYDLLFKYRQQTSQKSKGLTNWATKSNLWPKLQKLQERAKK